jgi:thiol-disulfide isomerase/thioredoxin
MRALAVVVALASCATTPTPHRVVPLTLAELEASPDLDGAPVGSSADPTIVILFASWCGHCKDELRELEALRASHHVRLLGVNYRGHEEYARRGSSEAVRAFARTVPWLRVVPIGDALFRELGQPPTIPFLVVYDRGGTPVASYDRRDRAPPTRAELEALLARLGA